MGECDMRKLVFIPIILAAIGESLILSDKTVDGVGIHLVSLMLALIFIIFGNLPSDMKNMLQGLMVLPIFRIVNLSVPMLFDDIYFRYILICFIAIIPIYSVVKNRQVFSKKLETNYELFYHFILIWVCMVLINTISNLKTNSLENMYVGEQYVSIFLTISLSLVLMTLDTKYWNDYVSDTFDMCVKSLSLTFFIIVIYNVVMALQ